MHTFTPLCKVYTLIQKMNYEPFKSPQNGVMPYRKAQLHNGTLEQRFIVIIDNTICRLNTTYALRVFDEYVKQKFPNVSSDDILYVVYGNKDYHSIRRRNSILVDTDTLKMTKCHVLQKFKEEQKAMEQTEKEHQREARHRITKYGPDEHKEPVIAPFIIAALLVYFFVKGEALSPYQYGFSYTSVIGNKEYTRIFTYMFIHANIAHIFGNTLSLITVGYFYTKIRGNENFLFAFFLGGILSAVGCLEYTSLVTHDFSRVTVGASGAIFALTGALLMYYIMTKQAYCTKNYFWYIVVAVVISAISSRNVNNACHIFGILGGAIAEYFSYSMEDIQSMDEFIRTRKAEQ